MADIIVGALREAGVKRRYGGVVLAVRAGHRRDAVDMIESNFVR